MNRDDRAFRALNLLEDDTAVAPLQWWFEIRNVAVLGERRGRASQKYTEGYLERLESFPIEIDTLPSGSSVFALARRHGLTFYDAAYLELALRLKLPLATLDNELIAAAHSEGIVLI